MLDLSLPPSSSFRFASSFRAVLFLGALFTSFPFRGKIRSIENENDKQLSLIAVNIILREIRLNLLH